tara:strand:- start:8105 stop:8509 length:405 start_codon:yes stop_codon:yes gene_type:complete
MLRTIKTIASFPVHVLHFVLDILKGMRWYGMAAVGMLFMLSVIGMLSITGTYYFGYAEVGSLKSLNTLFLDWALACAPIGCALSVVWAVVPGGLYPKGYSHTRDGVRGRAAMGMVLFLFTAVVTALIHLTPVGC